MRQRSGVSPRSATGESDSIAIPAAALPISGIVITKNEADRIGRCVAGMAAICSEVIVMDSGSDDETVAVATAAGARVEHQPWLGFAAQKNAAIALTSQPWVLLLDADEWLPDASLDAMRQLFASGEVERVDVWQFSRRTHFLGTTLNRGGWGNELVGRLFRPDLRFKPLLVHEHFDRASRPVARIAAGIEHDTARTQREYADKLARYALLWAQQHLAGRKRAYPWSPAVHAAAYWLKACILRGGVLDGAGALRFHTLHARYAHDKYQHLRRLRRSS